MTKQRVIYRQINSIFRATPHGRGMNNPICMYYLFYGFLYLVSLLPMRILYFISDAIYGLIYYVFGYRKKVVMSNLAIAFPDKTEPQRIRIAKKFYHNFIDSFLELIKLVSAADASLLIRFTADVSELNELYASRQRRHIHLG